MSAEQRALWALPNSPCTNRVTPSTQGAQAVASGKAAEDLIYCILKERGYTVKRQRTVGVNIYNKGKIRVDIWVDGIAGFPDGLIIESKWQTESGSADEKLPYLVANIKNRHPVPTIVVIDGDGFRDGAKEWIRQQVDGAKLYAVFSIMEFLEWTIRNL